MNAINPSNRRRLAAGALLGLFVAFAALSQQALAAAPVGTWNVAGNLNVIAKFPGIINSTTALNAKTLGMKLTYGADSSFKSSLLGLEGSWTQHGKKIDIDLTQWMNGLKASVLAILPKNTVVDVAQSSFTAMVVSESKMTGNVKLLINARIPAGSNLGGTALTADVAGKIMIKGVLSNTPAASANRAFSLLSQPGEAERMPVDLLNAMIRGAFLMQLLPH